MGFDRRFAGELCWVLIGVPFTVVPVVITVTLFVLGVALSPLFAGMFLIVGTLALARGFGSAHRRLARGLLGVHTTEPPAPHMAPGLWNWFKSRISDPAGWRAIAYLFLRLPVSVVNGCLSVTMLLYGTATLIYPIYRLSTGGQVLPLFDIHTTHWVGTLTFAVAGALLLLVTPTSLHGALVLDRFLAANLLGPSPLSKRVRELERSRAEAIEGATTRLRRIERDLHDGAQAQLVALAMKLGIARDELAADHVDVDQLRQLVDTAHGNAKQALVELRDLARGIRPPALDAGLPVALSTLAARSAVDVRLRVDLPDRPSPAVETLLYFAAAELLTNAAKHGGSRADLEVTGSDGELWLSVTDEGTGGARISPGGGLAGVAERVRAVDGRLDVNSPPGGPTVVTVEIPAGGRR